MKHVRAQKLNPMWKFGRGRGIKGSGRFIIFQTIDSTKTLLKKKSWKLPYS
jgi:hypothetical protein